jgi:hypothetical protein
LWGKSGTLNPSRGGGDFVLVEYVCEFKQFQIVLDYSVLGTKVADTQGNWLLI